MEKFNYKKKYGQNFLIDDNVLKRISSLINPSNKDLIIEIGSGSGKLTKKLIAFNCHLLCFEIDKELTNKLNSIENDKTEIIIKDFLEYDVVNQLLKYSYENLYLIGNLPYYITTAIIKKIIKDNLNFNSAIFMVQKEVAQRYSCQPGSKQYSSLTVYLKYYFNIEQIFDISPDSFYPRPNVESSVIKITKNNNKPKLLNEELFLKIVKDAFQFKRKTVKNNLKEYNLNIIEEVLKKHNYNLSTRAECLSLEIFVELANNLEEQLNG